MDVRVVRTYGSSETAGGCVYDGAPIGNTVVRVVNGQLEISGSVLGEAYLGDPDRTAARFITEHGVRWYRTGDLGEIDANGLVRVLGRADNVIISGGEKVSLDAVERVVQGVPGFAGALVVAADDPQWGQVPVVVRPVGPAGVGRREGPLEGALDGARAGGLTAEVELASMARVVVSALGRAARPARLIAVPKIPLLASGKPDLHTLRLLAAASMER
jgi:O-succinylbenzoic acid--CoA ligase